MDMMDLLKLGANVIQGNSDKTTTNLDANSIASALGSILGSSNSAPAANQGGGMPAGLDLSSLIGTLANNGALQDIVTSWIGSGSNKSISTDQVTELLGNDKISSFASALGLSEDSAKGALADALPEMVDRATNDDSSLATTLLEKVGGIDGAMSMLGKLMK